MAPLQLRNHIPMSGPARREPVDGSETPLRVSLGFEPAWFTQRCGVDFSERWHKDPFYRHETLVHIKETLLRAFPGVPYWNTQSDDDTWTLSGAYGAYVIPAVLGCTLRYEADRWPVIIRKPQRSLQEWAALDIPTLLEGPFVHELLGQVQAIAAAGHRVHGYLNWQGVLNNAFNVRGQDIFTDLYEAADLVHAFLSRLTDLMIALAQEVQVRQRRSGFDIDQLDVSNCTMNMISPRAYRQFVFPYDQRIAERFLRFGVHTCNWNATPYLETLSQLPNVGYIDMGIETNLARAKRLFPDARRAVMYSPVKLHDAPLAEIRVDFERIARELAPCDIVLADIQAQTPDARVRALLDLAHTLETQGVPRTKETDRGTMVKLAK